MIQIQLTFVLLLGLATTMGVSAFAVAPKQNRMQKLYATSSRQVLEFVEPRTNITVKLVGTMHYNPASIQLTADTISRLALENKLGSVIIESCDLRWNSSRELNPWLQKILVSDMRTACDLGLEYCRPVVLGDQRVNVTVSHIQKAFQETALDLVKPFSGWNRIVRNITQAWQDATPNYDDYDDTNNYLTPLAFLDGRLLLAMPVSLFKYPLSYVAKSPIPTLGVLVVLLLTNPGGEKEPLSWIDYVCSFLIALTETIFFARVILKEVLQERNEILAATILQLCRLYAAQEVSNVDHIPHVPGSIVPTTPGKDKTIVAVLGMAHCNGIRKLLIGEKDSP
jgi:hypothetical protein